MSENLTMSPVEVSPPLGSPVPAISVASVPNPPPPAPLPQPIHANSVPAPRPTSALGGRMPSTRLSDPGFASPERHHKRQRSKHREIKETLNATLSYSDDGSYDKKINQYTIGSEIGSGSYGSVYKATDSTGAEYVGTISKFCPVKTDDSLFATRLSRYFQNIDCEGKPSLPPYEDTQHRSNSD
jgi:hypothetical protein